MMKRFLTATLMLGLTVGCAYSEEEFAEDYSDASCTRMSECEGDIVTAYVSLGMDEATAQTTYDDAYTAACETEAEGEGEGEGESTCEFDPDLAQECVTGVEELSCDFYSTGTGFPSSCTDYCG